MSKSKRESRGGARYSASDFLAGKNPERRDLPASTDAPASPMSPGRERHVRERDGIEEFVRRTWSERGGPLLGKPKEYNTTEDTIVPLGDERHVRRTLPPIDQHRGGSQPPGGDTISRVPFVLKDSKD